MSVISTNHVTKIYGKGDATFTALEDISIAIEAGESVAIVGKSGSGKSTLMHTLALLDKPTSGEVLFKDHDAARMKGRQLVFQQFFLNANDTVLNNVILPLKIAGVSRHERNKLGLAALHAVELESKAKNKAGNLSGGQKQRVCIARALINRPSIIFADEPTGNLDSVTGKNIEDLLFRLNQQAGITLIIVTHDPDIAHRCQRQLHIKDGRLVAGGEV
jgi:putative ABC transport system ATP-binding protein